MLENHILVVDDEPDLCNILKFNLMQKGYTVDIAYSAEEALMLELDNYALLLFDVMMQEMSGFDLLAIIRNEKGIKTPVIFITAMSNEKNILQGFEMGADDYIRKPFSINEVMVRVSAVLNRYKLSKSTSHGNKGLNLDSARKRIFIDKSPIDLTRTEYDLFSMLFSHPGKVYSRDEILNRIWPDQEYVLGRTVDVNIRRIRKKFGTWGNCIATRPGYGYYFDELKIETK